MTSHRTITSTLLSALLLTAVALPSDAFAGPLLSGYGGPGDGNQVILGSTVIGGAGGGGGSAGGSSGSNGPSSGANGSSSSASSSSSSTGEEPGAQGGGGSAAVPGSGGRGSSPRRGGSRVAGGAAAARHGSGAAARSAARADLVLSRHDASLSASAGSVALGLSGEDLWYVLLALAALAFTGFVTRRLARAPTRPEGL
ncbi:MAG TPA: hypothetical protein VGL54_03980 [Solirubrobacteraceae bacterium]